jgi:pyruvate/2-oxoglutarate dehydrogenase complex dihydrolipoamide dehydrogenase (E3) component
VPRLIGTDPEVAMIGLTPGEAAEAHLEVATCRADLADTDLAAIEGREEGFVLAYVERATGRLVGACVAGDGAAELVGPLSILMARSLPLAALAEVIPCRPSGFEALRRLASRWCEGPQPTPWSAATASLRRAWKRRVRRTA